MKDRIELAPQEVATFIERRTSCTYLGGEAGSDFPEREQWVQAQRKKLRCDNVTVDEAALRLKYRTSPELVQLLDDTEELQPW